MKKTKAERPRDRASESMLSIDKGLVGLVRFPAMPSSTYRELADCRAENLGELVLKYLRLPGVRESLYLASPGLYERIAKWELEEGNFNGLDVSLARYFLRMSYRSTPFGEFAAVAACEVGSADLLVDIPKRHLLSRAAQLDVAAITALANLCIADESLATIIKFYPNDTILESSDTITYIKFDRGRAGRRVYKSVEVESSQELKFVLNKAKEGLTRSELVMQLCAGIAGVDGDEAATFVNELVDAQVIVADYLIDITSQDMLSHMLNQLNSDADLICKIRGLQLSIEKINKLQQTDAADSFQEVENKCKELSIDLPTGSYLKVDLYSSGSNHVKISDHVTSRLETVLNHLYSWRATKDTMLDVFKERFLERYGDAEVEALHVARQLTALGILASDTPRPKGVWGFKARKNRRRKSINLLERILSSPNFQSTKYLALDETLDSEDSKDALGPKTAGLAWISLWASGTNDEPVIELRGISAQQPGRIMGRFAGHLPPLREYLADSGADKVAKAPLVVEIVHCPQDRLGNISARPSLTRFEIGLRAGGGENTTRLPLSDLLISVSNNRVNVRSKSLNRALSLRMSNAHNFSAPGCLAIYKFLNLIANQDSIYPQIHLAADAPNAVFTPGLTYRGVIISRPAWKIAEADIKELRLTPPTKRAELFHSWKVSRDFPKWVAITAADNAIPYNLENQWMVSDLIKNLLRADYAILKDVFPFDLVPFATSASCGTHHEVLLPFSSQAKIGANSSVLANYEINKTEVPIWGDWAYFKIYVPVEDQNALLCDLSALIDELFDRNIIDNFFFIRYQDKLGAHLRVRFRVPQGSAVAMVLPKLATFLSEQSEQYRLFDVSIATYVREVSRYGGDNVLRCCERIFHLDSTAAINHLKADGSDGPSTVILARGVDSLLRALGVTTLNQRLSFASRAAGNFSAEFNFNIEDRHRLGERYRRAGEVLTEKDDEQSPVKFREQAAKIKEIFDRVLTYFSDDAGEERLYHVRWSLIHMHCNRRLLSEARLQEAVIWDLLRRTYLSLSERRKREANRGSAELVGSHA